MAIIPIFIPHAGCPHQCVFCNQRAISGQQVAAVEAASQQIARWRQWVQPSRANEAAFYGGSFTGLPLDLQQQLLSLTDELLSEGLIGSVRLSTRPDYIDDAGLDLLARHNVQLVELGVQSMDEAVLAAAERGHTAQQVVDAMHLLKNRGFKTGIQLMVGMPRQDFASVQRTARQVVEMQPDIARIYLLLVIKNTPLEKSYQSGDFTPLTLEDAVEQSSYVYAKLTAAGINVIRVGLQPDDELCANGNIVAGPFHPSMGELVQSRLVRQEVEEQLMQCQRRALITFPARMESKVRGLKNSNTKYWREKFPQLKIALEKSKAEKITVFIDEENEE